MPFFRKMSYNTVNGRGRAGDVTVRRSGMRRVDLKLPFQPQADPKAPFETVIVLPELQWPQECACCRKSHPSDHHVLQHNVPMLENKAAQLQWQVPYCGSCLVHTRNASRLPLLVILTGIILYTGVGFVLFLNGLVEDTPLGYFLAFGLLAAVCAACYWLYKFARKLLVQAKMNAVCSHYGHAVLVQQHMPLDTKQIQLVFLFYNDDYAAEFAALNAGYLLVPGG
jgi:hypothetical protein